MPHISASIAKSVYPERRFIAHYYRYGILHIRNIVLCKDIEMAQIANTEFLLLQIIALQGDISGYEINKLVDKRGYRVWSDIGITSIYVGLDKLSAKKLVKHRVDTKKTG